MIQARNNMNIDPHATDASDQTCASVPTAEHVADIPALDMAQIKEYNGIKRWCHLSGIAISIVYYSIWAAMGGVFVSWLDQGIDNRWLGLIATVLCIVGGQVLIGLPLDYYSSFIVEKRFNLSNQTPRSWIVFQLKSWLIGGILSVILLGGLYAALWYSGRFWGVYVWLGMMGISIVLAKIFPLIILPMFYPAKPLDRPDLVDRLTQLGQRAGMRISGVFDLGLSKDTKKANAMLAGLGSTRRVYLSDTLLGAFNEGQIAVVFAHELGHYIHRHIIKMICLSAAVTSVLVILIYWRLNPFAGTSVGWAGAVEAFAQVMLIATLYPLAIGPITNAISRHFERQADWKALEMTDDADSYRGAFDLLTRMNLADPDPPRWEEIMFDDHPAMNKRLAMADAYERRAVVSGQ